MRDPIRRYGLRLLLGVAGAFGMAVANAHAYISTTGSGTAGAGVSSLTAPGAPHASLAATSVSVTWTASTIGAVVAAAASSYTVERYDGSGTDLGEASCGAVSSSMGIPDAFGSFSCTDSPVVGTFKYRITAHYRSWTASGGFTNSVSAKGNQSIEFEDLPASERLDEGPIAVTAKASSGLPVTFESETTDVCTTSGGLGEEVTFLAIGTCTIRATQTGNEEWNSVTVEQSFAITSAASTLTALSPASVGAGEGTSRVAVSPDGKNVYATNRGAGSNSVSQYARNTETGKLTALAQATVATGTEPESVVVSSDANSVYVANRGSNTVSQYARSPATGALTLQASLATGAGPIGLAISPDGKQVYAANATSATLSQFSRNTGTGELKALAKATVPAGANVHGVLVSPDGKNVYATNYNADTVSEYARSEVSGELTALGTVAAGTNPHDLAISPDGDSVYVANSAASGDVLELLRNAETGILTFQRTIAADKFTECIVVSPDGSSVYATNEATNDVSQYSRDMQTGDLTALAPAAVASETHPEGIAVTADGHSVYVANSGSGSVSQYSR
jgi:DNA-binding beta-propeller fold protein YncE